MGETAFDPKRPIILLISIAIFRGELLFFTNKLWAATCRQIAEIFSRWEAQPRF